MSLKSVNLNDWFHTEVISRTVAALVWPCVFQIPIIILLSALLPLKLTPTLLLTSLSHWTWYFSLCFVVSVLGCIHHGLFKVAPRVYVSRWDVFKGVANPLFATVLIAFGILSTTAVIIYGKLCDSELASWITTCADSNVCLNEPRFFIALYGLYLGIVLAYNYYCNDGCLLSFPLLHLPIRTSVLSRIVTMMKKAVQSAAKHYLIFLIVYLFCGGLIRSRIASLLGASKDSSAFGTFGGMLNLTLALKAVLLGASWVFTYELLLLFFQLYQTKHVMFNVQQHTGEIPTIPLLSEVLKSKTTQLLYLWGCLDFCLLTEQSTIRRAEIFQVSHPGNHPHNWNSLIETVIPTLESYLSSLNGNSIKPPLKAEEVPPLMSVSSPLTQPRLRRLATPMEQLYETSPAVHTNEPVTMTDKMQRKIKDVKDQIMKTPFLQYLFGEFPDAHRRVVFASSQPIIWVVEGLSRIIAASFTEDSYGVLRKDLGRMVSLLVDLDTALDLRSKGAEGYGKFPDKSTKPPRDVALKRTLKWTVKSSIYRIINSFHEHILQVDVTEERRHVLQQYLDFRKN